MAPNAASSRPPSLSSGTRLGAYTIEAPIGAGGMGEVYRARDTRLGRSVAIKVLPPDVASDPSRRHRFEREARAVAALEHPHICVLHDIGSERGVDFLVMELLEGQTLAHRLKKGRIPRDEALRIAIEIAEALDAAHRQGITHRDLKPANVMLTKSGVKLLDFGLAKLRPAGPADGLKTATTEEPTSTETGVILGTLPYMAPEQVEGREADARSDIWALGVVLYEMLSGRRAFAGASAASLIASILEHEPEPLRQLDELTPPALDRAVRRCLQKDPDARWQSARDAADELKWVAEGAGEPETQKAAHVSRRRVWPWVAATALLATVVLGLVIDAHDRERETPAVVRTQLSVAPAEAVGGARFLGQWIGGTLTSLALSPDGHRIVFVGERDDQRQLYVRSLESAEARPLGGTEDAENPFFSPDGRWVGYWARERLWKVPLGGGPPVSLCALPDVRQFGATWGTNGRVLFAAETGGLRSVPEDGGAPVVVTSLGPDERGHRLPHALPGGGTVLYTAMQRSFDWTTARVVVESLQTGRREVLVEGAADGRYVPTGHVVFLRLGKLMAAPFDERSLELAGSTVGLQEGVAQAARLDGPGWDTGAGQLSVSSSGNLVYLAGGVRSRVPTSLLRLGRDGALERVGELPPDSDEIRVSPDGRRAVVAAIRDDGKALFLVDIGRATTTHVGAGEGSLWSPDGRELVIAREGEGLLRRQVDLGTDDEVLLVEDEICDPGVWLDGGDLIIVRAVPAERGRGFQYDIERLEVGDGVVSTHPIVATEASEWGPSLSPDGRWLAYVSNESGRPEVYVRSYPEETFRAQVSPDGGGSPSWARDGTELFYYHLSRMMAVSARTGMRHGEEQLVLGKPAVLFAYDSDNVVIGCGPTRCYDVAPDGGGFYAAARLEPPSAAPDVTQIHLVLNWAEELKARVPVGK